MNPGPSTLARPASDPPPRRPLPPAGDDAHPSLPPLGAAGCYLLGFGVTCGVFLWTRAGQRLDGLLLPRAERGGGYEQRTALLGPAKTVLEVFGDRTVLVALLGGVLLLGVLGRRLLAGVVGVVMVLGAVAVAGVAKSVLIRPDLQVQSSTTHNSFPSGHVTAAAALLMAFLLVAPRRARAWIAVPGAAGVSVVAAATMLTGWHRASDAVGGVLLAATLCCLASAVLARRRQAAREGGTDRGGRAVGALGAAPGLVLLLGALLVVMPGLVASVEPGPLIAVMTVTGLTVAIVVSVLLPLRTTDLRDATSHRSRPRSGHRTEGNGEISS
ncbi:phosphatase PAP2 family protein [Micromonospora krabiensis]|uniref:phosphatase PAP2 family protein n=1 Tax=Micromonospora krabiensis TaxID=307121 RepID=UPI0012FE23E5|nr:phosphatase PAP2 family protein [Micromonospora krabiensis]